MLLKVTFLLVLGLAEMSARNVRFAPITTTSTKPPSTTTELNTTTLSTSTLSTTTESTTTISGKSISTTVGEPTTKQTKFTCYNCRYDNKAGTISNEGCIIPWNKTPQEIGCDYCYTKSTEMPNDGGYIEYVRGCGALKDPASITATATCPSKRDEKCKCEGDLCNGEPFPTFYCVQCAYTNIVGETLPKLKDFYKISKNCLTGTTERGECKIRCSTLIEKKFNDGILMGSILIRGCSNGFTVNASSVIPNMNYKECSTDMCNNDHSLIFPEPEQLILSFSMAFDLSKIALLATFALAWAL